MSYFTPAECRRMEWDDLLRRLAMWPVYGRDTFEVLNAEYERRKAAEEERQARIRSRRRR